MITTQTIYRAAFKSCNSNMIQFSLLIKTPHRTLYNWLRDPRTVPGAAQVLIRMLAANRGVAAAVREDEELERLVDGP